MAAKVEDVATPVKSWWESFDISTWLDDLGISYSLPVQAALCFGAGFAIGFLFKKYFKFCFVTLLTSLIIIKALEYNGMAIVDWEAIPAFFGIDPHADPTLIAESVVAWVKGHLLIVCASLVGFLFGARLS